jgi:ribonuclease HII
MRITVGIDEAGRGPLAGPVAVGAVAVVDSMRARKAVAKAFPKVKDSKQLSEKAREVWFAEIKKLGAEGYISWTVSFSSAKIIDDKGIAYAITHATTQCLRKLHVDPKYSLVLLDGGLRAPEDFINQKTIVRGDTTNIEIALASICAKVMRDRKMVEAGKRYRKYGFEIHKGYGTKQHLRVIEKLGTSSFHRKTFCERFV